MMFGKKKLPKWQGMPQNRVDKLLVGYQMALEDIDAVIAHLRRLAPADPRLVQLSGYRETIARRRAETVVGMTGLGPIADEIEAIGDAVGEIDDEIHALPEGGAAGAPFAWGVLHVEALLERGETLE